jgi:hypothetical protein
MDVTDEGLLIKSTHCLKRSIVIKHEATRSPLGRFCLLLEGFDPIEVTCHSISSCSHPELVHATTLLHLVPGWKNLLLSGLIVRGASFAMEKTELESFRVYYNDPIDLKLRDSGPRDSNYLTNVPSLHGEVISQPRSISINIGKQAYEINTDYFGAMITDGISKGIQSAYNPRYRRKADGGILYSQSFNYYISILGLIAFFVVSTTYLAVQANSFWQYEFVSMGVSITMFCAYPCH